MIFDFEITRVQESRIPPVPVDVEMENQIHMSSFLLNKACSYPKPWNTTIIKIAEVIGQISNSSNSMRETRNI